MCCLQNESRRIRHLIRNNICPICENEVEIILHAIKDCVMVARTWLRLLHTKFWGAQNMTQNLNRDKDPWSFTFGVALSSFWYNHNKQVLTLDLVVIQTFAS